MKKNANTTADHELDLLLEAKRTAEANRRRQEALRAMIAAKAAEGGAEGEEVAAFSVAEGGATAKGDGRRSRRLWPVWLGSAAASLALLLAVLPMLLRSGAPTPQRPAARPMQVALAEPHPLATPQPAPEATAAPAPQPTPKAKPTAPASRSGNPTEAPGAAETINAVETAGTTETNDATDATETTGAPEAPEPEAPAPTILRRTSDMIACTEGCELPEVVDIEVPSITFFGKGSSVADAALFNIRIER